MEASYCFRPGANSYAAVSRFIFLMYIFGGTLFCAGFLLSVYVFQACKVGVQDYCTTTFKVLGPSLAIIGLASVVMAKSRSRMESTRRPLPAGETDPDQLFLFGESRQFFQCLIFGFLMVTCGVLVSILGAWIPGCKSYPDQNVTGTSTNIRTCGLLSLQILGPVIILIGLGFFVMGHLKKRRRRRNQDDVVNDEEPQAAPDGQFHVTVGELFLSTLIGPKETIYKAGFKQRDLSDRYLNPKPGTDYKQRTGHKEKTEISPLVKSIPGFGFNNLSV